MYLDQQHLLRLTNSNSTFSDKNNSKTPKSSFATCQQENHDKSLERNDNDNASLSLTIFNENIQDKMLTNYVKLLLIFNFIPLIGFCVSIIYYRWYIVSFGNDHFWINLLYVYDQQNNEIYRIAYFKEVVCWVYLQKNQIMNCEIFNIFHITGGITFFFMAIASVMHIFHIGQLIIILLKKYQLLQLGFCIKLKTLQVSVFILYIGGIFIWVFFILLSQKTVKNYGASFYIALVSAMLHTAAFCYFVRLKKVLKERKMINNLLNPDSLLNRN